MSTIVCRTPAIVSADVLEIGPGGVCVHLVSLRLLRQRFFDRASAGRRRDNFRLGCYHAILCGLSDATVLHHQPHFYRVRSAGSHWSSARAEGCRLFSSRGGFGPFIGVVAITGEVGAEDYYVNLPSPVTFHRNLTAEQYERLVGYIDSERAKPQVFNLIFNNCNDFVAGAAHAIGLKAPLLRMLPPTVFVKLLAQMNS